MPEFRFHKKSNPRKAKLAKSQTPKSKLAKNQNSQKPNSEKQARQKTELAKSQARRAAGFPAEPCRQAFGLGRAVREANARGDQQDRRQHQHRRDGLPQFVEGGATQYDAA